MSELAPGSILQRIYLNERINTFKAKSFCEVGSGNGFISKLLLEKGMSGVGFDLNSSACENNKQLNAQYIAQNKYKVINGNFFEGNLTDKFDLIISCMVIEHLDAEMVHDYFEVCKKYLNKNGKIVVLVPSSMKHWGIEDEIAGHFKRYSFSDFEAIANEHHLKISNKSGLTYPISNWLLGLSNYLVKKSEGHKSTISMQEQTIESGNRNVKFKTDFPIYFKLLLNNFTMYPFHVLQKINSKNENSLVMYCEFEM